MFWLQNFTTQEPSGVYSVCVYNIIMVFASVDSNIINFVCCGWNVYINHLSSVIVQVLHVTIIIMCIILTIHTWYSHTLFHGSLYEEEETSESTMIYIIHIYYMRMPKEHACFQIIFYFHVFYIIHGPPVFKILHPPCVVHLSCDICQCSLGVEMGWRVFDKHLPNSKF